MFSRRVEKLNKLIKEEVSDIIQKEIKDPRIGFVTVMRVEVSVDLRQAKVYISVYGGKKDKEKSMKGLESAKGYIQGEIGRRVRLRYTPEISFKLDESLEKGFRVLEIMKQMEDKKSND